LWPSRVKRWRASLTAALDRPLRATAVQILAGTKEWRVFLPNKGMTGSLRSAGKVVHPAFSFERHDPPLPPRQRTPFAGGRNHHYSAFGASTAAGASAGASTAGASVGTASTAGAASGAFTSSTVGSSGVIAITPREVGENRRGHLP
jgi:hypothetical protein